MTGPGEAPASMLLPTVEAYSDGVWLADGRDLVDGGESDAPQVLTDLVVRWGRSTVVDQPQPSTCSLTMMDRVGGTRFLDLIQVGGRLDVLASATITVPPDPDDPGSGVTVIDERFTSGTGNAFISQGSGALTASGGVLNLDATAANAPTVTVPPAPRQPVGGDPTAWDTVPRAVAGQAWTGSVDVRLPDPALGYAGWAVQVRPATFDAPWGAGSPQDSLTFTDEEDLGGGWVRWSGQFVPPTAAWIGLSVRFWPIGPAWNAVPATVTWESLGATPTWQDLGRLQVDNVLLKAPSGGALRQGMVFSGRITDLEASYDDVEQATFIDVTATDQRGELGNRDVGDDPWLEETLGSRFERIVTASGQPISSIVSPTAAALRVSWRDVDRQPAIVLLDELATSADGVLWAATHPVTGPYLELESLSDRPALFVLVMGDDGLVHIELRTDIPDDTTTIDACDVLLDPIRWRRDVEDTATRVAVTWRDQTLNDDGQPAPTDRTETVYSDALETQIGVHRVAISTQLSRLGDAQTVAAAVLGRTGNVQWRVHGLEWRADTTDQIDGDALTRMMTLLDGTTRNGLPLLLTNLPGWTPIPDQGRAALFLEGGTYTSHNGGWVLDLVVSAADAVGGAVPWQDLPGWAVRHNRMLNPRAVSSGAQGWTTLRGFNTGGAGTHTWVTTPTPPLTGVTTVRRKTWTTAATNNNGNAGMQVNADGTNYFPVTAGEVITASCYIRLIGTNALQKTFVMRINWWNQVPVSGATQVGAMVTGTGVQSGASGTWQRVTLTATVPAGALGMQVFPDTASVGDTPFLVGEGIDCTCLLIEAAPAPPGVYFDGSTDPAGDITNVWDGAANASTSTQADTSQGWAWDEFDPAVAWADLSGVNGP